MMDNFLAVPTPINPINLVMSAQMGKARYNQYAKFADKQATITNASDLLRLVKSKISDSVEGVAMAYKLFRAKADGS